MLINESHQRWNLTLNGIHETVARGVFQGQLVHHGSYQGERIGGGFLTGEVLGVEPDGAVAHVVQQLGLVLQGLLVNLGSRKMRLNIVSKFGVKQLLTDAKRAELAGRQHVGFQEINVTLHSGTGGRNTVGQGLFLDHAQA